MNYQGGFLNAPKNPSSSRDPAYLIEKFRMGRLVFGFATGQEFRCGIREPSPSHFLQLRANSRQSFGPQVGAARFQTVRRRTKRLTITLFDGVA